MSSPQNGTIFSGEHVTITVSLVDGDSVALDGAAVDAIASYQYIIATSPYAATNLISKTIGAGVTLSNTAFTATIVLDDTDTDDLDGQYYHEAKATDSSGNETTSLSGKLVVRRNVL